MKDSKELKELKGLKGLTVIKQTIGASKIDTVDARELWAFLESKQDFSNWIQTRIKKYNFVEGIDFILLNKISERAATGVCAVGGYNRRDYTLFLDMAKELSMLERNDKGKQARQYFIECERQLEQIQTPAIPKELSGGFESPYLFG